MSKKDLGMDDSYVQKLKYMSINGGEPEPPRYGRIATTAKAEPPAPSTYHQKQRSIGAIESFASDVAPQKASNNYRMYDRSNVISSSKFATPRQVRAVLCYWVETVVGFFVFLGDFVSRDCRLFSVVINEVTIW